jgi:ubiquinone/menaquinone biosynthesis C-methylase UbiE
MDNENVQTRNWYEKSYGQQGFKAQRLYPNEELLRFLGRNYFNDHTIQRKSLKILEVGCGSCSNLWMIAKEGFDTYGIDISEKSLELGKMMLDKWGVEAELLAEDMTSLGFENSYFDVIVDVFSSNCLDSNNFNKYLKEVNRVLKVNGKFFIYTPSEESDAFKNYHPAEKIDDRTLSGIMRKDSPFYGNFYPFRFESTENLIRLLKDNGLECTSHETISRTYHNEKESFQHISLEAVKVGK